MELNRFRPYGFRTMFETMDYHIYQVHRLLVRHMFTEHEFITNTLPRRLKDFQFIIKRAVFDIFVVLTLSFAILEPFPFFVTYNGIVGESFGVKEPKKISFSYLITIVCLLDCVYMSFTWLMQGRMYLIRVLYEWRRTLDSTVKKQYPRVYKDMLDFFNYASYATGLNIKTMAVVMAFLVYMVCVTSIQKICTGLMTSLEAGACILIFASSQLQFAMLQYICYTLLCGLFLCLKILKHETRVCLKICTRMFRKPKITGRLINGFRFNLMHTHRRIFWYNMQVKEYNFCMDTLSMLATTWSLDNVLKNPEVISFIFLALFFTMYFYSYFMGERAAFFKECTKVMIKRLHSFSADYSKAKLKPNEKDRKLDRLIKVDDTINFLNNAKFGFTYGSQYIYTKRKVVENALVYVYILMLLSKTKKD